VGTGEGENQSKPVTLGETFALFREDYARYTHKTDIRKTIHIRTVQEKRKQTSAIYTRRPELVKRERMCSNRRNYRTFTLEQLHYKYARETIFSMIKLYQDQYIYYL